MVKKIKTIRKISQFSEYLLLVFMRAVFHILPKKLIYFIIKILAVIAFDLLKIRRFVTLDNLKNALGNVYTSAELLKIARSAYINIGMTLAEILFMPDNKSVILSWVENEVPDDMKEILTSGKGVIFTSAHFGSWEVMAVYISAVGFKLSIVAKRLKNPFVDKIISRKRKKFGFNIISHKTGMKTIISELKNGGAIALISDQDAGLNGVFVNFFGRKASTHKGAAQLAIKFGTPLVVIMCYRTSPGKYSCIAKKVPITTEDTVESLTQKYSTIMEKIITEHPEQYFWMHRRWKTLSSDGRKTWSGINNTDMEL
jgi:Kdo2-lipid IVA lauroyltransferase/acyltransferase